jgi:outer membrane protein assembly factor BamB
MDDLLFVATGRWIAALSKSNGRPVWRRKLPRWFASGPVTLLVDHDLVFAGRGGYVYCLDAASGDVMWERGLDAGKNVVLMATPTASLDQAAAIAAHASEQAAANAAAASG